MNKLYFRGSNGNQRVIAECNTLEQVNVAINRFIAKANENKKKPFVRYYTRMWVEDNQTWFDVGSHTEYFIWDKAVEM